jgi:hypothetical protein
MGFGIGGLQIFRERNLCEYRGKPVEHMKKIALLLISVENARPISWQSMLGDGFGVNKMKMKRTGISISNRFGMTTP